MEMPKIEWPSDDPEYEPDLENAIPEGADLEGEDDDES